MINDYGICIDTQLVQNAIAMNAKFREQALQRAKEITGLDNPNSPLQVLGWLEEQGVKSASLDKEASQNCSGRQTQRERNALATATVIQIFREEI